MKKNFIVLIAVCLLAGSSVAVKTSPSNEVGFRKLNISRGYNLVAFPVLPDDSDVDNVIGGQLTGAGSEEEADQIAWYDPEAGEYVTAWYNSNSESWEGDLETLDERYGYWIFVPDNHPESQTIRIAGNTFEQQVADMGEMQRGFNLISNPYALEAVLTQTGLTDAGMTGDEFLFNSDLLLTWDSEQNAYLVSWIDTDGEIHAGFESLEPDKGYWLYINPDHEGFAWEFPFPTEVDEIIRVSPNQRPNRIIVPQLPWSRTQRSVNPDQPVRGTRSVR